MNLLDRISRLEIAHKILWCIIIAGGGVFIVRIVFGLLSKVHNFFGLIGAILGLAYTVYIVYRIFFKKS